MNPGGRTQNLSLHYKHLERPGHRVSGERWGARWFFCWCVKAPIICCICSGVMLGSGCSSFPLVSGLGLDVDPIVLLLVGTASFSSESDPSSELSVVELAARECWIDSANASPSPSSSISVSVRSISWSIGCWAVLSLGVAMWRNQR